MRHIYAFMHAITIIEPQGHVYEREQDCIYGRALREEKEGRNDLIIL